MAIGSQVASLYAKIGADTSGLEQGLAKGETAMKKTAGSMAGHGHAMTKQIDQIGMAANMAFGNKMTMALGMATPAIGALGVAVGGAAIGLGMAVGKAAEFEKQMSAVKAIGGLTKDEIAKLSDTALKLGPAWGQSASEVGRGMEELVKAGVSTKDIMGGAAEATITLAAAGGVSLAQAAEVAANSLQVFNLKGSDMAHVADYMAGAANATTADVNDLRLSMSMASAVSAQMGQTFEGTTTVIALMAQAGIKGSDAGTSLKQMMLSLTPASDAAAAAMASVGIITSDGANRFFTAEGAVKSYREIAQILQQTLGGLSEEQRISTMRTIFGSDAIRAGSVLVKGGAEAYDTMTASIEKVKAADVARARLDNLAGSIDKMKAQAEAAAIAVGNELAQGLNAAAKEATHLIGELTPNLLNALQTVSKVWTITVNFVTTGLPVGWNIDDGLGLIGRQMPTRGMVREQQAARVTQPEGWWPSGSGSSTRIETPEDWARPIAIGATSGIESNQQARLDAADELVAAQRAYNQAIKDGDVALIRATMTAIDTYDTKMDRLAREEEAQKKLEAQQKKAASAASSAANEEQRAAESLARTIENKTVDAGELIRDLAMVAAESAEKIADIGAKYDNSISQVIRSAEDSIQDVLDQASRALDQLDEQERINAESSGRRKALEETISVEERAARERMGDQRFHWQQEQDLARINREEQKALAKAKTGDERRDISARAQEERAALQQRHLDFDAETRFRIQQEDELARLKEGWDARKAALEKELHEADVARRRTAIIDERDRKVAAIRDEMWARVRALEEEKRAAIKAAEEEAKKKLASMKLNFWNQVPEAAKPGMAGVADLIAAAFGGALSSVTSAAAAQLLAITAQAAGIQWPSGGGDGDGIQMPVTITPITMVDPPEGEPGTLPPPDPGTGRVVPVTPVYTPAPSIDYQQLASAMSRQPVVIRMNEREVARVLRPELDQLTGASW